ncbi:hypothetical protein Fcan01_18732 [Folsomia candida]|uniref:Uncharacterized protein n=1 Tax=Folsomia candida TaxID=158441 RepID=A0A226DMX1_FOLCA|nr:hypothetical protein Fcan01_18732 [Folsomia candida]
MRDLIQSDSVYLLGVNVFRKVGKIRQKIQIGKLLKLGEEDCMCVADWTGLELSEKYICARQAEANNMCWLMCLDHGGNRRIIYWADSAGCRALSAQRRERIGRVPFIGWGENV